MTETISTHERVEANRKYKVRAELRYVEDLYGKPYRDKLLELVAKLSRCSVHKIQYYILAYTFQTDKKYRAPVSEMVMFLMLLNQIRISNNDTPLELRDLYHPEVYAQEITPFLKDLPMLSSLS